MSGISFSGLTSGLNTDRIISQLLSIERQPIRRYNRDIEQNKSLQDSFKKLNTKTGSLQDAISGLTEPSAFKQKKASSTKSDVLGATVVDSDEASQGTQNVFVEQLATKASVSSGQFINDQKMVASNGDTLLSDFEQVEGSGKLDPTSDGIDALSKQVQTGAGNDIRIEQTDADGDVQSVEIDLDHADIQNINDIERAIKNPTDGSISGATTVNNNGGPLENFHPDQWSMEFEYDRSRDKFFMQPTNQDGSGGRAITLEDLNGADKGFFQQIGFNSQTAGNPTTYGSRQSSGSENLVSIDADESFSSSQLLTSIPGGEQGTVNINGTTIQWDTDASDTWTPDTGDSKKVSTVNEFVEAVNEKVDGVQANFNSATDKISMKTTEPGQGTIEVTDGTNDGDGGNVELADALNLETEEGSADNSNVMATSNAGQDAKIDLDGTIVSRSSNTFTIDGVEYNLKEKYTRAANSGDPIEVSVDQDTSGIASNVKSFVDKFNSVIEFINKNSQEQAPDAPGDSSQNQSGPFIGDTTVRMIKNQITSLATRSYSQATDGGNAIESLADVGIELVNPIDSSSTKRGTLTFDEGKFKQALQDNPEQVREVFSAISDDSSRGGAQDGAAVSLNSYLEGVTGGDGIISSRIDGLDSRIDNLNERIEDQKDRLQRKRKRLEQKFLRMEESLLKLKDQQNFLSSRL